MRCMLTLVVILASAMLLMGCPPKCDPDLAACSCETIGDQSLLTLQDCFGHKIIVYTTDISRIYGFGDNIQLDLRSVEGDYSWDTEMTIWRLSLAKVSACMASCHK